MMDIKTISRDAQSSVCGREHMGFELQITDRKMQEMPEVKILRAFSDLLSGLAGVRGFKLNPELSLFLQTPNLGWHGPNPKAA